MFKRSQITRVQAQKCIELELIQPCPVVTSTNMINPQYDLMIVIPAYNVERYLDECLQSVLNQKTKYDYHIMIVNDGSTDVLTQYEMHSTIIVIYQVICAHWIINRKASPHGEYSVRPLV